MASITSAQDLVGCTLAVAFCPMSPPIGNGFVYIGNTSQNTYISANGSGSNFVMQTASPMSGATSKNVTVTYDISCTTMYVAVMKFPNATTAEYMAYSYTSGGGVVNLLPSWTSGSFGVGELATMNNLNIGVIVSGPAEDILVKNILLSNTLISNGNIPAAIQSFLSVTPANTIVNPSLYRFNYNGTGYPFFYMDTNVQGSPVLDVSGVMLGAGANFLDLAASPGTPGLPSVPCFTDNSRLLTPTGYKAAKDIMPGDTLMTSDGREVAVKVYRSTICTNEKSAPYLVPKGSLGHGVPTADLCLSPLHAIQIKKGVWLTPLAAAQVYSSIKQYDIGKDITYHNFEAPNYFTDNFVCDGTVVESFGNLQAKDMKGPVYTFNRTLRGFTRASGVVARKA